MTKDEALRITLEALQDYVDEYGPWSDDSGAQYVLRVGKEALAQPEQEKERCVGCEACIDTACGRDECPKGWPKAAQPEKDIPKIGCVNHDCDKCKAQPEQKPVGHSDGYWCDDLTCKKCYSADFRFKHKNSVDKESLITPPQRKPLTDEVAPEMWAEAVRKAALPPNKSALLHYKEAIEAAHGIKE